MRVRFLALAFLAVSVAAHAQLAPLGPTFTISPSNGYDPAIATNAAGEFFVVWNGGNTIFGRFYDEDGDPVGTEFQISDGLSGSEAPAVTGDGSGGFVTVWQESDLTSYRIAAQRYDSAGTPVGTQFVVTSTMVTTRRAPAIAAAPTAALVVWEDSDSIGGQILDAGGLPQGTEFEVASTTLLGVQEPDVAVSEAGDFMVVWTRLEEASYPNYETSVFGRRIGSDGSTLGTEFKVNDVDAGEQYEPAVTGDADGNFVVVWNTYKSHYNYSIDARRFDGTGAALAPQFSVSTAGQYSLDPDVVAVPNGGFVVVWAAECGYYCYDEPFGRRYSDDGAPLGPAVMLEDEIKFKQEQPVAAINDEGTMFAAWYDQTTGVFDVRGALLATSASTPICEGGSPASNVKLKLGKLTAPGGDELMILKGELAFPPGEPAVFDPSANGAQLLVEDTGNGDAVIFELSFRTVPVAGGAGCSADDGWTANTTGTAYSYKNKSGALPPACTAGSAGGLQSIKLKDKREKKSRILFAAKLKNAALPGPIVGPLRATIVTAADSAASTAGECGAFVGGTCVVEPDKVTCQ